MTGVQTCALPILSGIRADHVPYSNVGEALTDVIAGRVHFMFADAAAALPLVRDGKLLALGASPASPISAADDIRPVARSGLPGFDAASWHMLAAPAATPAAIIARLNGAVVEHIRRPEVRQRFVEMGLEPGPPASPAELLDFVGAETRKWGAVIRDLNLAAECGGP